MPPSDRAMATLHRLAHRVGPHVALWRCDPFLLTSLTDAAWLHATFQRLCVATQGATTEVVVSTMPWYRKTGRHVRAAAMTYGFSVEDPRLPVQQALRADLAAIAHDYGLAFSVWAQPDLVPALGQPARCVSVYCYAVQDPDRARDARRPYDPHGPFLTPPPRCLPPCGHSPFAPSTHTIAVLRDTGEFIQGSMADRHRASRTALVRRTPTRAVRLSARSSPTSSWPLKPRALPRRILSGSPPSPTMPGSSCILTLSTAPIPGGRTPSPTRRRTVSWPASPRSGTHVGRRLPSPKPVSIRCSVTTACGTPMPPLRWKGTPGRCTKPKRVSNWGRPFRDSPCRSTWKWSMPTPRGSVCVSPPPRGCPSPQARS